MQIIMTVVHIIGGFFAVLWIAKFSSGKLPFINAEYRDISTTFQVTCRKANHIRISYREAHMSICMNNYFLSRLT